MPAGASWTELIRRLFREIGKDDLLGLASQCAYAAAFAIFPFLIFLVSVSVHVLPKRGDQPVLPPEIESQMPAQVIRDTAAESVGSSTEASVRGTRRTSTTR